MWGFAAVPSVTVFPEKVIQGEPVKVTLDGVSGAAAIFKISFDGKAVGVFLFKGKLMALIGIDLNKKLGIGKIVIQDIDEICISVDPDKKNRDNDSCLRQLYFDS
jgi:hypothetical protein